MSHVQPFVGASTALPSKMAPQLDAGGTRQLWPLDVPVIRAQQLPGQHLISDGFDADALMHGEAPAKPAADNLTGYTERPSDLGLAPEFKKCVLNGGFVGSHAYSVAPNLPKSKQSAAIPMIKLGMDIWKRIENELHSRRQTNAWFGRKMGASRQVVAGWKKRGVPAMHYEKIAALFGWSLDKLVSGADDGPVEKAEAAPATATLAAEAIYSPMALEIARTLDKIGDLDQKRRAYALILQITALDSAPSPTVPAQPQSAPAALTTPAPSRVK